MDKTVSQYVIDSLRLAGQLPRPGAGAMPEAILEVTEFLNQMLDSWNTMRNSIYLQQDQTFTLNSNQYIYTIGTGGNFNAPRPQQIQRADVIYETSPQIFRLPLRIVDVDTWAAERVPNLPNAIPLMLYYDNGYSQTSGATGLGQIYLWPGPQGGYQLELWYWQALTSALIPAATIFLPPGYARAITYNLAAEILPLYPKRVNPAREEQIVRIARESKYWVDSLNSPSPKTIIDPAVIGKRASGFNWLVSVD